MILWQTVSTTELSTTKWTTKWKKSFLTADLTFHLTKAPFTLNTRLVVYIFPLQNPKLTYHYQEENPDNLLRQSIGTKPRVHPRRHQLPCMVHNTFQLTRNIYRVQHTRSSPSPTTTHITGQAQSSTLQAVYGVVIAAFIVTVVLVLLQLVLRESRQELI